MFPLIILIVLFTIFLINMGENKKEEEEITTDYNKKIYYKTDYLGGHPIETEGVKYGVLNIIEGKRRKINRLEFTNNYSQNLFEIEIKDITNCKLETKKTMSAKRIALVGILAFGLKKGRSYIRISFNHKLGKQEIVLFNHNKKNKEIVKKINSARMIALKTKKSKNIRNNNLTNENFDVSQIANDAKERINKEIDNM